MSVDVVYIVRPVYGTRPTAVVHEAPWYWSVTRHTVERTVAWHQRQWIMPSGIRRARPGLPSQTTHSAFTATSPCVHWWGIRIVYTQNHTRLTNVHSDDDKSAEIQPFRLSVCPPNGCTSHQTFSISWLADWAESTLQNSDWVTTPTGALSTG